MVLASMRLNLFKYCFLLLLTSSEMGRLPKTKRFRPFGHTYVNHRDYSPVQIGRSPQTVSQFENSLLRKQNVDFDENVDHLIEHLQLIKSTPLRDDFDENGMIFLSLPKDRDDRHLNALLNKIVQYKMDEKQNDYLRHNPESVFSEKELETMRDIVGDIENDEEESYAARSRSGQRGVPVKIYDFADLVV